MFAEDPGKLIRCDCGHALADHTETGCATSEERCGCRKTPSAVLMDEIALLRPDWLSGPPQA